MDLIILSGQSNAVGYDTKPNELPPGSDDQRIMFWWRCGDPVPDAHDSSSGGRWKHLQAQHPGEAFRKPKTDRNYGNFSCPAGGFGPEIGLARTIFEKERKPIAILKAAWSGTGMRRDWNLEGEGGECARALLSEINASIIAAQENGWVLQPRAFIWVQGESDANPDDAPLYSQRLNALLEAVRGAVHTPGLPAFLAVNTRFGANPGEPANLWVEAVIAAQKALAKQDNRCVYVDTEGASLANSAHFDSSGTLEIGARFAASLLAHEAAGHTRRANVS